MSEDQKLRLALLLLFKGNVADANWAYDFVCAKGTFAPKECNIQHGVDLDIEHK